MFSISIRRISSYAACLLTAALLTGCEASIHHWDGLAAMNHHEYVDGVRDLAKASELQPDDLEFRKDSLRARETAAAKLLALAGAALAEGRDAEAERCYRAILQFDRENARAKAGLEYLARAVRAAEDASKARESFKQGDIEQALAWVDRALKSVPQQAEARAVKHEIDAMQAKEMLITPSLGALYKKPINLEFRDASIKMVFDALSRTTGINFIFDRDVKGDQRTTVFLKQTTLDDAIDVILSTNQLEKKVLNPSSVLIYPNTAAKTKEYQDLVVKSFYLANVEAKEIANSLKTVLKIKDVYVEEKYNIIVLRETPETIVLAEKLIAMLDLDEPEVMLDVEVLEVNRSRLLNLGVAVSDQLTIAPLSNLSTTTTTGGATTATPTLRLSDLKHLNSTLLGVTLPSATINMQKVDGDANLLANPRIRVRDREKAKFLIGDKVPVVTTTSSGTFVTENIQYLDVGLKLEVEPDIHLHDEIGLKMALEVSSLVSSIKTSGGSTAYQIGTRNFNSSLRLKDGETQILAGLISDEDRSAANKIPLLGELPVLGRLFSSHSDNHQKTELVLSITPHLIRNIQRGEPASEAFWSGTEANLRNRSMQLRNFDVVAAQGGANKGAPEGPAGPGGVPTAVGQGGVAAAPGAPQPGAGPVPAPVPGAPVLAWHGPARVKPGETFTLELAIDSADSLRAASLQLAFNPAEFDIVSVKEGDYFSKSGKGSFSQAIDNAGGRVSVGAGGGDTTGAKGAGQLLTVVCRAKAESAGAEISVIGMTPIGGTRAVARPNLPVVQTIVIAP